MKNATLIFVLICLLSINLSAQSDKGKITLGGSLNFTSVTNKSDPASSEQTTTNVSIIPQFGYYVSDAIKIGLGVGYTSLTTENKPSSTAGTTTKNTRSAFVINPFARFYVPASEQVDLFVQGNFSFSSGTSEFTSTTGTTTSTSKSTLTSIGIFLAPGIEYRISQRISLDLSLGQLGYFTESTEPDGTPTVKYTENTFRFSFDLSSVALGVNIFL